MKEPASGRSVPVPRIAVVGCGAIARASHVPALLRQRDVASHLILVDRDVARARSLAAEFGVQRTADNYLDILPDVDGIVVTVPHHLHYRITMDCLRAGKHVLCEKPLSEAPQEARELVAAAEAAGVTLAVNHIRRLYPVSQRILELVRGGAIGNLRRIEFLWGEKFDWPAVSGFYFGIGGTPHGVLLDKGPHVLDLICWWLGGKPEVVSCYDDSFGGGEATVSLKLHRIDCTIDVELSFLSRYPNSYSLTGDTGRIEASLFDFRTFDLVSRSGARQKVKIDTTARSIEDFGEVMIDNFLAAVGGTARPLVSGADVLESVVLIDECYARRQRYDMPWHEAWRQVLHG